jgi:hypothetical protein
MRRGLAASVWFCEMCYCVVASESNFEVSVFKEVGGSAYVWGEKGESCPFRVVFCVYDRCCVYYFVLYLPLQFMYQGGWEVVSPGYVKNGMPFFVLPVVLQGEAEHSFCVVSVCCEFVFCRVVGQVVNGGIDHCGFTVEFPIFTVVIE